MVKQILPKFISKDLEKEAEIKQEISYYPIKGCSKIENFRSPNAYVFILFEKCSGTHTIDFITYEEENYQLHISYPEQIHSWDTMDGALGHKIIVSRKFAEKYLIETIFLKSIVNKNPVIKLTQYECICLVQDFVKLASELAQPEVELEIVKLRALVIIMKINNLIGEKSKECSFNQKNHPSVRSYLLLVESFFKKQHTVAWYAKRLGIEPNYLNILCRKNLQISAKDVIHQRLILEVKRLLLGSDLSIKEISYLLGFSGTTFFSSYIKKHTGFSPKDLK
ncbi:MAG: helix-turn-helix domain-containing protein [Sphingobacterium sp.]|jgi:AraC-like DNA-binding protein|nr:helix-turn-helix domain-containing protein [Sphingobacterium sp.]